ncbi:MAG: substrate-binding domain-containing protein [Anaerolineaceae bacterium]|nr:substrate-binding domain-containing protein [Anaerolineaceae bacterium]
MEQLHLYQQIAESIRLEIVQGHLKAGDSIPSVRAMTTRWDCTPGTIQRAYRELAGQGLITSRPGQGTKVTKNLLPIETTPLRRAGLVNRAEEFLLEVLSDGYNPFEVEQAFRLALDRWRAVEKSPINQPTKTLMFIGSHDPAVVWLSEHFSETEKQYSLQPSFTGSLGGLMAIAEGKADLTGIHLWDEETGEYNIPFVRRLLPGQKVALLNLSNRRMGLIVAAGNPKGIKSLIDLVNPDVRFINRQSGSGTRVWLDAVLHRMGINSQNIHGYNEEKLTHSETARCIAEGKADAALGLQTAALSYGLDFIFLTLERYDLVITDTNLKLAPFQALRNFLLDPDIKNEIAALGGYETSRTGEITWVE